MFHGKTHVISMAILDQSKLHSSRAFQALALDPGALRLYIPGMKSEHRSLFLHRMSQAWLPKLTTDLHNCTDWI